MLSLCGKKCVVPVNFHVLTISFSIPMKLRLPDSFGCEAKRHAAYTRSLTAQQRSGLVTWKLRTYHTSFPSFFCVFVVLFDAM